MNRQRTLSFVRFSLLLLLTFALMIGLLPKTTVNAADINTNRLTNDKIVSAGGLDGGVDLHLKKLDVAQVVKNKMAAYYPGNNRSTRDGSGNAMGIEILTGKRGKVCDIKSSIRGNLEISIDIAGIPPKVYTISMQDVCNTNKFYGKIFNFPNGNLFNDASGYKKANITVRLDGNVQKANGTSGNDFNYRIRLVGPRNSTAKLALLKKSDYDEVGLRSAYSASLGSAPNKEVAIQIPFGYPCDTPNNIHYLDRAVRLYDADAGFGDTYMWITRNGSKLEKAEYNENLFARIDKSSFDGTKRWKLNPSNQTYNQLVMVNSVVNPGDRYRLHVLNDGNNSTINPHNNTLSVSIPNDSIYADVNCDYGLIPHVSVSPDRYSGKANLNPEGEITETDNGGNVAGNHSWQMYALKYSATPDQNLGGVSGIAPCSKPSQANLIVGSCRIINSASYPAMPTMGVPYSDAFADPIGTYTCFFTRVQNPTNDPSDDALWRYSQYMECAQAGKLPTIQVWGGDVRAGGTIQTSTAEVDGQTYGSWGEYGVFSDGQNEGMASGNGLYKGNGSTSQVQWSALTFANIDDLLMPAFGNYGGVLAPAIDLATGPPTSGDLDINATNYAAGDKRVIYVEGTAYIHGNLQYLGGYSSIARIPRIVIVADNIVIDPGVTRIDPWLVATQVSASPSGPVGNISTCSAVRSGSDYFLPFSSSDLLDVNTCNERIVFNSPVVADKIYLYRTAGNNSGADADEPAELFNLRADTYLSAVSGDGARPIATTDAIIELPPRF